MAAVPAILVGPGAVLIGLSLPLLPRRAATAVAARLGAGVRAVAGSVVAASRVVGHMALMLFTAVFVIA